MPLDLSLALRLAEQHGHFTLLGPQNYLYNGSNFLTTQQLQKIKKIKTQDMFFALKGLRCSVFRPNHLLSIHYKI